MAIVKGVPVIQLKVVPHRPLRNTVITITYFVLSGALIWFAYLYGISLASGNEAALRDERNELRVALEQALSREEEVRQRVAILENASMVDQMSTDEVRQVNRELSDRIAALEEENALYQGIMSPSVNSSGLTVQEVAIAQTASENRYRFKVMLTQVGNNTSFLSGLVGINVIGVENGEVTAYPLKDISPDIDDVDIRFRYRYFQDFSGELVLPDGFTPDQIQVIAQSVGNNAARVERLYDWKDLENDNNVMGQ